METPNSEVQGNALQPEDSCFATCEDASHRSTVLTGPIGTGANAGEQAQEDAHEHNKANPGHNASISCSFR